MGNVFISARLNGRGVTLTPYHHPVLTLRTRGAMPLLLHTLWRAPDFTALCNIFLRRLDASVRCRSTFHRRSAFSALIRDQRNTEASETAAFDGPNRHGWSQLMIVNWVMTPYGLASCHKCFGVIYCLSTYRICSRNFRPRVFCTL